MFVELLRNDGWYDTVEDPEKYILGIARNLICQYYRKREKSIKTIPIEEIDPVAAAQDRRQHSDPTSRIRKQELTVATEEVLAKLPSKARQALKLRFVDGLISEEAAKRSGCMPSTIRKRICRTLERIKPRLRSRNGR